MLKKVFVNQDSVQDPISVSSALEWWYCITLDRIFCFSLSPEAYAEIFWPIIPVPVNYMKSL